MNYLTECSSYPFCKAPLCPLDPSFNCACWYPDEDICSKHGLPAEQHKIIKTQRKIKKKSIFRELSFTVCQLNTIKNVHTTTKGKNSDNAKNLRSK